MTNTNESSMQKMMREKTRQEHKQAVQDYAKKGFDNGYNLRSYMQMIDVIGGPKDAEEYTEICEDFMEPVSGNIHAEQNLIFVDPTKYKINESQYIRIFKTPLSIDGRLFILVKPKEHKLSKKTYYELAKIAVSAEHYLARANIDDTAGPTYAKQMALVNPEFLEPGKYKEIFNSDRAEFGGGGNLNPRVKTSKKDECDEKPDSIRIKVPPMGISVFSCTRVEEKHSQNEAAKAKKSAAAKKTATAKTAAGKSTGAAAKKSTAKKNAPKRSLKEELEQKVAEEEK